MKKRIPFQIRILPLTIFASFMLLTVKVGDVLTDLKILHFGTVQAAENPPQQSEKTPPPIGKSDAAKGAEDVTFDTLLNFDKNQVDILKALSKKRHKLEEKEKEILAKSHLVEAAQKKLDSEISKWSNKETVKEAELVKKENQKKNNKISELAKIYQSMKPGDAAKILETLDMDILLPILGLMSPIKSAPIFAAMAPAKAKEITEQLASL